MALGGCGPGNILWEIAKKADRKELDQVRKELEHTQTDNAHLHSQMTLMAEELGQKSEEVRKYHAEQAMVFTQIRELIGHPGEFANKAWLYDQLVEAEDPTSAKQTIPILVKYARRMNDLFAEIQKIVHPGGTPRRVLYQGSPRSPSGALYEVVGKVAFVQDPPAAAEPSQQGGGSRPGSSGRDPERTHSSGARRNITGPAMTSSVRSRRGQSPAPRTTDRSRTPDRARTLIGTKLRIERQAGTRVRPMHFQPPPPFRLTTQCRSHFPLRPLEPPRLENHRFPEADDTRSSQPENPPPLVRVSGRVPFPEHPVPGRRERRRQATRRMRLLPPQT
jgi:hypothetical protein